MYPRRHPLRMAVIPKSSLKMKRSICVFFSFNLVFQLANSLFHAAFISFSDYFHINSVK